MKGRDMEVRRYARMPSNRENPGVHHTARQSRDREGASANSAAGMRSLTVTARIDDRTDPLLCRAPHL